MISIKYFIPIIGIVLFFIDIYHRKVYLSEKVMMVALNICSTMFFYYVTSLVIKVVKHCV